MKTTTCTDAGNTTNTPRSSGSPIGEPLLCLSELAAMLRIHINTARRLVRGNSFPRAFKIERDWRIPRADVNAWIERRMTEGG